MKTYDAGVEVSHYRDWPKGRSVLCVTWGVSSENGDALALTRAGQSGCVAMSAEQTFHGDHDEAWVVELRQDGSEIWHNAREITSIQFAPSGEAG